VGKGTVVEINNDLILVEAEPGACCDSCPVSGSCSYGVMNPKRRIWMENRLDARIGDVAMFYIPDQAMILSSAVVYFIPTVMLIAGIAWGATCPGWLGMNCGLSSIVLGCASLIMSCGIIKIISGVVKKNGMFVPRLIEVSVRKK
jgi:positive regulator of sigma E activity